MSPLGLASHGSSGGASLLGIISIDDDDRLNLDPPLDGNGNPYSRCKNRSFASRKKDTEAVAKPGLRRSDRVRARQAAYDVEMDLLSGGRLL
jgi:hypothetical protein